MPISTEILAFAQVEKFRLGTILVFLHGIQEGAALTFTDTWLGNLAFGETQIGDYDDGTTAPFYGWIAHVPIWNKALTSTEISELATA